MPIREDSLSDTYGRKHPVPQNVMDVEFKVVGDLSVRQVMYLFLGGALVFLFYKSGLPLVWRWGAMIGIGLLSIAVAFVPVQERGLDRWLVSFFKALLAPTQRIWKKTYTPPSYYLSDYAQIIKNEIITLTPAKSRNKLEEYLGQIEDTQTILEINENQHLSKIQGMYDNPINLNSNLVSPSSMKSYSNGNLNEIHENEMDSKQDFMKSHLNDKKYTIPVTAVDRTMYNLPHKLKGEINISVNSKLPSTITINDIKDIKKQEEELEDKIQEFIKLTQKAKREFAKQSKSKTDIENKQKKLNYINQKYDELQQQKTKLKTEISESTNKINTIQSQNERTTYNKEVETLAKQNQFLEDQLRKIQAELQSLKSHTSDASAQSTQVRVTEDSSTDPNKISANPVNNKKVDNLKNLKVQTSQVETRVTPSPPSQANITTQKVTPTPQDVTILANIVHGIVKGKNGDLIEDAVVMIKDAEGDVIRALKTNAIGQFKTQTALSNGKYTIQAIKGSEKFDIISIEIKGEVLSPIKLIGY